MLVNRYFVQLPIVSIYLHICIICIIIINRKTGQVEILGDKRRPQFNNILYYVDTYYVDGADVNELMRIY